MKAFDSYFFSKCPLHICALFRVAYATLLLINILFWAPNLTLWFGQSGYMSYEINTRLFELWLVSIFAFVPNYDWIVWLVYLVFILQTLLLIFGIRARFNAACCFFWLVSFVNQNAFIWDGEDIVFSMLGFFLIFLPIDRKHLKPENRTPSKAEIWPLRLIQLQMCLIYLSTSIVKLGGSTWADGTALYYAYRMTAAYPRFYLPGFISEWMPGVILMTKFVLIVELILPFALLYPKTRKIGLILALLLHLGIEYSMNLFLFQWIMLVGLISFLSEDRSKKIYQSLVSERVNQRTAVAN